MHNKPTSKNPNLTQTTKAFIDKLTKNAGKPLYEMTPDEAREFLENLQGEYYINIESDVKDMEIHNENESIDLRIFKPVNIQHKLPAILYIHGGGWILGGKNSWDRFLRQLANCTNSTVIFPQYSLSPEVHYPKALDQIYATYKYIQNHSEKLNIDKNKIVIAGDSAGGNIATVTTMKVIKENIQKPIFQLLFYPVTDAEMKTESYNDFADGPWLTKKAMEWFWDAYEPDKNKRKISYISTINADLEELQNMPETLIITDENDVLRDEGEAYAKKLDEAGVKVTSVRINGTFHDFIVLNSLCNTEPAKTAFLLASEKLKLVLK